jgi:PAS domain S-box-containing protein
MAGNILEGNHTATVLLQTPKEFLTKKPLPVFVANGDRRAFYSWLAQLNAPLDAADRQEVRLQPYRGEPINAELTVAIVTDQVGQAVGLRWQVRDITQRKRLEHSLSAEKRFTDRLLEAAPVLVLLVDDNGQLRRTNAYVETVTGYVREELAGAAWSELLLAEPDRGTTVEAFAQALATGQTQRLQSALWTRDGRRRSIAWTVQRAYARDGTPQVVLAIGHDVTDLETAQQQAVRLERLAAVGEMAAGLAHESRNILQRSQACLARLHWKLEGQVEALDLLARAETAHADLVRLYEDVRRYAAPLSMHLVPCDLAAIWREVWADLLAIGPRDAALDEDLPEGDRTCWVDRFRLGQVFRNILENSLAACADPVRVRITCRDVELGEAPALEVHITDNGPGLSAEQRARLFEPFYTTKVKGTGLGMAIVKRIVEAHRGTVSVGNDTRPGTEIIISLPRRTS